MRAVTQGLWVVLVAGMGLLAVSGTGCARRGSAAGAEGLPLPVAPVMLTANAMEVRWQTPALIAPDSRLTNVWVCGSFLVCHGSDHRIYVIDARTGVRLWSRDVAEPHETVWRPAVNQQNLWLPTTTKLLGFEGLEGKKIAEFELDFAPAGPPATNGIHVFIPDAKGWLQAVSVVPKVVSWGRWTKDSMTAGPVADTMMVYFGGRDGAVYASTQYVRSIQWAYQTEGPIVADLKMTDAGLVLVASLDYSLYAFQGANGRLDWRYNAGERIRRAPYAFGDQVFVFTQEAGLTALDENGKIQWRLADGDDIVTADEDTVYVLGRGNDLLAVGRADGKVRWGVPLRRGTLIGSNETGTGILYLATPEGQVLAVARKQEAGQGAAAEAKAPAP